MFLKYTDFKNQWKQYEKSRINDNLRYENSIFHYLVICTIFLIMKRQCRVKKLLILLSQYTKMNSLENCKLNHEIDENFK